MLVVHTNRYYDDATDRKAIDRLLTKYQSETPPEVQVYTLEPYLEKIEQCFNRATSVEQIFQNLAQDPSEWCQKTLVSLRKMSPTSLKISFKLLRLGSKRSLRECFCVEFRTAVNMLKSMDLYEGVRSGEYY